MSFMYQSMMSRAPGKRKIKLQEENILRLMQDDHEEDEEDMDFEVTQVQEDQAASGDNSGTGDSATDSSSSDSEDSEDENINEARTSSNSLRRKTENGNSTSREQSKSNADVPTVKTTNEMILSKYYRVPPIIADMLKKAEKQLKTSVNYVKRNIDLSAVRICCVCLKKKEKFDVVTCQKCFITVHTDCCKVKNKKLQKKSWFCEACISAISQNCEMCPSKEGYLKETNTGQWCHVVCARYILKTNIFCLNSKSNSIDFSNLNSKFYGTKECYLCDDRLMAKTGICVKCDAGLCKAYFHVTCAQKHGLLSENETGLNSATDPYFVYCPLHLRKEELINSQKVSVACFAAVEHAQKHKRIHRNRQERLNKSTHKYITSLRVRPTVQSKPGAPQTRLLSSNAYAMRELNKKAEIMYGIDVRSPATYFPCPTDVRKRHRVPPNLTGEFVSHYADRELRITEMNERVERAIHENQVLVDQQSELRQKYEDTQKRLISKREKQQSLQETFKKLKRMLTSMKEWSSKNTNSISVEHLSPKRPRIYLQPLIPLAQEIPPNQEPTDPVNKISDIEIEKYDSDNADDTVTSHLLKTCNICSTDREQHLLVKCDVCNKWSHLGCLDPPLTQMPRKTKFALWQCSECAPASDDGSSSESDEDQHGSLITAEGRRLTRRVHRPPEKLSTSLFHDLDLLEERRMISYFSRSCKNRKNDLKLRKQSRDRLRRIKKNCIPNIATGSIIKKNKSSFKVLESQSSIIKKNSSQNSLIKKNISQSSLIKKAVSAYRKEFESSALHQSLTGPVKPLDKPHIINPENIHPPLTISLPDCLAIPLNFQPTSVVLKKSDCLEVKKSELLGLKKGDSIRVKNSDCSGVKKGELLGLKKGDSSLVKNSDCLGVKKGECQVVQKDDTMGVTKGIEVQKGEFFGLKKGESQGLNYLSEKATPPATTTASSSISQLQSHVMNVLNGVSKTLTNHTWKSTSATSTAVTLPRGIHAIRNVKRKPNILRLKKLPPNGNNQNPMKIAGLNGLVTKCTVVRSGSITEKLQKIVKDLKADNERKLPLQGNSIFVTKKTIVPIKAMDVKPKVTLADNANILSNSVQSKQPLEASDLCNVCKQMNEPLKMMQCFKCHHHYHIWCCDPPRTCVPKPSKFSYWLCADCTRNGSDDENPSGGLEVAPDGRKRITRCRRPPEKFVNTIYSMNDAAAILHNRVRNMRNLKSKNKNKQKRHRKLKIPPQCNTATQPPCIHKLPPTNLPTSSTPCVSSSQNNTTNIDTTSVTISMSPNPLMAYAVTSKSTNNVNLTPQGMKLPTDTLKTPPLRTILPPITFTPRPTVQSVVKQEYSFNQTPQNVQSQTIPSQPNTLVSSETNFIKVTLSNSIQHKSPSSIFLPLAATPKSPVKPVPIPRLEFKPLTVRALDFPSTQTEPQSKLVFKQLPLATSAPSTVQSCSRISTLPTISTAKKSETTNIPGVVDAPFQITKPIILNNIVLDETNQIVFKTSARNADA